MDSLKLPISSSTSKVEDANDSLSTIVLTEEKSSHTKDSSSRKRKQVDEPEEVVKAKRRHPILRLFIYDESSDSEVEAKPKRRESIHKRGRLSDVEDSELVDEAKQPKRTKYFIKSKNKKYNKESKEIKEKDDEASIIFLSDSDSDSDTEEDDEVESGLDDEVAKLTDQAVTKTDDVEVVGEVEENSCDEKETSSPAKLCKSRFLFNIID